MAALNGEFGQLTATSTGGSSRTTWFSTIVICLLLAGALGVTAYGLISIDWRAKEPWPGTELREFLIALALPAAALILGSFSKHWPKIAMLVILGAALVTYGPAVIAVIALCGFGWMAIGQLIFRMKLETTEEALLAVALGFGCCGVVVGMGAGIRVHFDFIYAGVFLGAIALARRPLASFVMRSAKGVWAAQQESIARRALNNLGVSAAIVIAIALSLYASALESGFDALTTHFAFTEQLRQHGVFRFDITVSPAAYMPKASVWGLAAADVLGGEFALRAVHALLLAGAAALIGIRASRWMWRGAAGVLAATLLSAPVAYWISSQLFEETGALLLATAAAVFLLRGSDKEAPILEDWMALAALGLAVSAKAQDLFLGVLGVAIVLRRVARDPSLATIGKSLVGIVIFAAAAIPFYARAFFLTGNPFYPIVAGQSADPRWSQQVGLYTPYDVMFGPGFRYMENYVGGFAFQYILMLAAGVAVLFVPRGRSAAWLGLAGVVFAAAIAMQSTYARYQIYSFPMLALALAALFPFITVAGRSILTAALAAIAVLNVAFWPSVVVPRFTLGQLLSPEDKSSVEPVRRAFGALNALYGSSTVVYVTGRAPFSAGVEGIAHGNSDLAKRLNAATSPQEIARLLRDGRVTQIVTNDPLPNPRILEVCRLVCREYPLTNSLVRIFEVDLTRASLVADRVDAAELLGVPGVASMEVGEGWAPREEWGWWSVAPEASVKLSSGFVGATELKVKAQAFAPPGTQGLDVTILLDGVQVAVWRFEPGPIGKIEDRTIPLPQPFAAGAQGVLTFQFSHTYSPQETLGGGDTRRLALGLVDIGR
jgi:hypothetical protein